MAACGGFLMAANEASAQETVVVEESVYSVEEVDCKDIYSPGSWRNNWYIQLGRHPLSVRGELTRQRR